jgi:hypothetical protein
LQEQHVDENAFYALWLEGAGGMEVKLRVINWKGLQKKLFYWFIYTIRLLT